MRLRILLPPTLAGSIQRNSIPAKVELENSEGNRIPPEKCAIEDFGELPDAERAALFALSQWCGGKLTSFLQLNIDQAAELLELLDQKECFFPANSPDQGFQWIDSGLKGVSEYIGKPEVKEPPRKVREIKEAREESPRSSTHTKVDNYKGPPIEVEGSTEYLRIILPSSEHPDYTQVLRLLRDWSFIRDRSHRHWWWLRDSSKVLDFLASHQEDFELEYQAEFTENFRKHTSSIKNAVLSVNARETGDMIEIEACIKAGDAPMELIEHALATGRNHFKHGSNTFLLSKELREKSAKVQRQASGQTDAPLLAQSTHNISRFQSITIEDFLIEADPRFKPPSQWKKRGQALRDLASLPPPDPMDGLQKFFVPTNK